MNEEWTMNQIILIIPMILLLIFPALAQAGANPEAEHETARNVLPP